MSTLDYGSWRGALEAGSEHDVCTTIERSGGGARLLLQIEEGLPRLRICRARSRPGSTTWRSSDIVPVPAQLPADVQGFTGRRDELMQLDAITAAADSGFGAVIVVITGAPGVGKTALAVNWANRHMARYIDGQLFVDLHGFDPAGGTLSPLQVVSRFLRQLGVSAGAVPRDLDEATDLYRTFVAGRQMLVVLDNARDVEQVRPLLPGTDSCHVIVTSRRRLGGLVARQGARLIEAQPLDREAAVSLMEHLLGQRRRTDSLAMAGLARRCGYLPLALRVAAANLALQSHLKVDQFVSRLDEVGPMAVLRVEGDEHNAVATAFGVSFASLPAPAQEIFRCFGLLPGHDFEIYSMAAIKDFTLAATRKAVDELTAAHLLTEQRPGRFGSHDLLRAYARERAHRDWDASMREEVQRRLVDFYTDTTNEAQMFGDPRSNKTKWETVYPPLHQLRFAGWEQALAWFDQDCDNIMGAVALAASHGWHNPAWRLAEMLYPFLGGRRLWNEWLRINQIGLMSAEASTDREAAIRMHICLGVVHKQTGDYPSAHKHWTLALHLSEEIAHRKLAAACRVNLGGLCINEGYPATGAHHLEIALAEKVYSSSPGNAIPLNINYGCALIDLGRLDEATDALTRALSLTGVSQDPINACHAHQNLAEIALRRSDPSTAAQHARQELNLATQIGDPLRQATAHDMLGSATCGRDTREARRHWEQAHAIYHKLHHRRASVLTQWLDTLGNLNRSEMLAADTNRRLQIRKMI